MKKISWRMSYTKTRELTKIEAKLFINCGIGLGVLLVVMAL